MTITLYGFGHSRSFRCLWALEEAGLDYDYRQLDLASADSSGAKSADYLALNQQGKVPTLVEGDFTLTESAAILNYIGSRSTEPFIPQQPQDRARYDELVFFIMTELEQPLWSTGKHRFAIPEEWRIPKMLETAKWEFDKALNGLDALIDLQDYALGDQFSFADILLAQTLNWADRFKFELPQQHLDYRDRMYSRDAAIRAKQLVE